MKYLSKHLKLLSAAVLVLGLVVPAFVQSALAQSVAEVVFTIGDARIQNGASLSRGAKINVGDTVITGANGHVHLRFVDQAFVSVRPSSSLKVEQYTFDTAVPENNRVKFVLSEGTSRLITGQAGQMAKQNFRLNTPVAAIGVRGTDFVVQATADNTRVTVQQGAVVMSPFGEGCAVDALGPCGGNLARQLSGSLAGSYLDVSGHGRAPVLMTPAESSKNPNTLMPARPEEPSVSGKDSGASVAAPAVAMPVGAAGGSGQIWWGRWGAGANSADLVAGSGKEVLVRNEWFVLMRATDSLNFPKTDTVKFAMVEADAYKRSADGKFVKGDLTAASLSVDFSKQTFKTALAFEEGGLAEKISAQGKVTDEGRFQASKSNSNAIISGGLSNNGDEAAYYFQKNLEDKSKVLGIVRWQR
ncbi:MAG: hypothetical protein RIR18_1444 [Pseudomonadota bacterium]|jgi:hypothetical protein